METDLGDQDRRRGLEWILECDGARGRVGLWGVESGRRGEEKVGWNVSFGNVGRIWSSRWLILRTLLCLDLSFRHPSPITSFPLP